MTYYTAAAAELEAISTRFTELDEHLSGKLKEFDTWMRKEFPDPRTVTANGWRETHWPWAVVTMIGNDYGSIDIDQPTDETSFRFTMHDRDGDTYIGHLPFLWLEDPEAFRQRVITLAAEAEQADAARKLAQAATLRAAKIDAARELLAEVDGA